MQNNKDPPKIHDPRFRFIILHYTNPCGTQPTSHIEPHKDYVRPIDLDNTLPCSTDEHKTYDQKPMYKGGR